MIWKFQTQKCFQLTSKVNSQKPNECARTTTIEWLYSPHKWVNILMNFLQLKRSVASEMRASAVVCVCVCVLKGMRLVWKLAESVLVKWSSILCDWCIAMKLVAAVRVYNICLFTLILKQAHRCHTVYAWWRLSTSQIMIANVMF